MERLVKNHDVFYDLVRNGTYIMCVEYFYFMKKIPFDLIKLMHVTIIILKCYI